MSAAFWVLHGGHLVALASWVLVVGVVWVHQVVPRRRPSYPIDWPVLLVAAAGGLSGAVHLVFTAPHLAVSWLYGGFFVVVTAAQVVSATWTMLRPTRLTLVLGAAGSLAVVLVWLVTRTVGIPLGVDAGQVEPVGLWDGVATLLELVVAVVGLAVARVPVGAARREAVRHPLPTVVV